MYRLKVVHDGTLIGVLETVTAGITPPDIASRQPYQLSFETFLGHCLEAVSRYNLRVATPPGAADDADSF
jgi:hypothetical protein